MERSIKIGISSCLLGEKVRYDGLHKLDSYLTGAFGPIVEWAPVCPEIECGLPVPREAIRLEQGPDGPRLVTVHTGIDHTERLVEWSQKKIHFLQRLDLCGFIFKGKSPSCGVRDIEIRTPSGLQADGPQPKKSQDFLGGRGPGIFARILMNSLPLLPVEDDERLHDPAVKEIFIKKIFEYFQQSKL
ncbi:MAG: DUF523 domain-containing protein [Dissulfurispiraceae bacterium]|jgi:uncharacterized protein YbbK (DUF523 family)